MISQFTQQPLAALRSVPLIAQIHVGDAAATARLAAKLAPNLQSGDVLALTGPLGSGKTSLTRGLLRARGVVEDVPSPSYNLVQTYTDDQGMALWHFDLYRLERPSDIIELGMDEAFESGISVIEWPERLGEDLPPNSLIIGLEFAEQGGRDISLWGAEAWQARLAGLAGS